MGAAKKCVRRWLADGAMAVLSLAPVGRVFDWLAWQRRRTLRRQVEARLRAAGQYGDVVSFGPFKGLRYPPGWADSRFEKIIGAYEAELHPVVESLCATPYADIVNIGAAEGYYAVGLARRIPAATVHAFEMDEARRQMCRAMAELNGVAARVHVLGVATVEALRQLPLSGTQTPRAGAVMRSGETRGQPGPLVVCDCEGAERELLNPEAVPWLAGADVLVEVHEFMAPGVAEVLRRRFAGTHELQVIPTAGLAYAHYPQLQQLTFAEIHAMVGEERSRLMEWFWLKSAG
ncbi:MAG: hypothetical protein N3J91_08200 [Verrucomicrobiae bacterium]|nr:hypothetical protein [Verrucomicrobiae bacterium]